jgi:hypothetical protein
MTKAYVVDTSYLLELYRVPGFCSDKAVAEIVRRVGCAIEAHDTLHVPFGCILELGNHIADVPNGQARHELASRLETDIEGSVLSAVPWAITPAPVDRELVALLSSFRSDFAFQGLGLVDSDIIGIARRLKSKYGTLGYSIHIWTKDQRLKAHEPDPEESPFVGSEPS